MIYKPLFIDALGCSPLYLADDVRVAGAEPDYEPLFDESDTQASRDTFAESFWWILMGLFDDISGFFAKL